MLEVEITVKERKRINTIRKWLRVKKRLKKIREQLERTEQDLHEGISNLMKKKFGQIAISPGNRDCEKSPFKMCIFIMKGGHANWRCFFCGDRHGGVPPNY